VYKERRNNMGDPRKLRKHWEKPKKMFDRARIEREKELVKKYGFRRKREIWKLEYIFKKYKRRARKILAEYDENEKNILINKLARQGILEKNSSLDDVLNLKLEDFCERRLQTIIYKKELANTIKHARQLITHKKVIVGDKIVDQPNYLVLREEEDKIKLREKKKLETKVEKNEEKEENVDKVDEDNKNYEKSSQDVKNE